MSITITDKICDIMIKKGLIDDNGLRKAREIYTEKGGNFYDILVKLEIITKKDILALISEISDLIPVDMTRLAKSVDPSLVKLISRRVSLMYQVVPLSKIGKHLTLAMADPMNIFTADDIKKITGLEIIPVLADKDAIDEAVKIIYDRSAHDEIQEIVKDINDIEMKMIADDDEKTSSKDMLSVIEEAPVIKLTNMILTGAVDERASDILIEPLEKDFRVRYRIDGTLHVSSRQQKQYHSAVVSRLKVMSNLDIAERRLPQDGRFKMRFDSRVVDFRISIIPSICGEKTSIRVLDKQEVTTDINKLGISQADIDRICAAADTPYGMILVCGPTGAGKTTTLYSIVKYVDRPTKNLVTVEDPVEYEMKGINQVAVRSEIGLTFASSLRSILRQDPDIILIGEIRDYETSDIAIKSALTGHLVLSTLHTNRASGSIVRLVNMGIEPFLLASSIILVVGQRLVRKLCPYCKEVYKPASEVIEQYKLFDKGGKTPPLYRPSSCPKCRNTGYSGRMAITECMKMSSGIKDAIFNAKGEIEIENIARKEGMVTLRENGIELVLMGLVSLEEILRVTSEDREIIE